MKRFICLLVTSLMCALQLSAQYSGKSMAKLCNIPPLEAIFVYVDAPIVQLWAPEDDFQYLDTAKDCIRIVCPEEKVGSSVHFRLITETGSIFDVMARVKRIDPKEVHTPGYCYDFTTAECSYKLANTELAIQHAERFPLWGKLSPDDPYGNISMTSRQIRTTPRSTDMQQALEEAAQLGDQELILYLSRQLLEVCKQHKDANSILRSVFKTNSSYVKDIIDEDANADILMEIANKLLSRKN